MSHEGTILSSGDLSGRTALITGAGSGIGAAVARAVSERGCATVLVGRRKDRLAETAAAMTNRVIRTCDVRREAEVDDLVANVGPIDVLVNAAGVAHAAPIPALETGAFDDSIATNLRGVFLLCRALLPRMRERGTGSIVNILSVAARTPFAQNAAYAASKAGLAALSAVMRVENRDRGIRVIDLYPGATDTPLWDDLWPEAPRERMMPPEDVARAVVAALTASDAAMLEEIVIRPQGGDL